MIRLALLTTVCAGIALCADDPPKKLTPDERKQPEAKWKEAMIAGGEAHQDGRLADAAKACEVGLRLARQFHPKAETSNRHANLATSLNGLAVLRQDQGQLAPTSLGCVHLLGAWALSPRG